MEQIVSNLPILGPVYKLLRLVLDNLKGIQRIVDNFSEALCNAADLDANKVRQNLVAFLRNSLDGIIDVINNQIRLDAFLEPLQRAIGQIKDSVQRVTINPLALAIANALTAILGGTAGGGGGNNGSCDQANFTYQSRPPTGYNNWTDYVVARCSGSTANVNNAHGHHIVMKGNRFTENEQARQILCKYGINPFIDCANLVISPNKCHSRSYAQRVLMELRRVDQQPNANRTQIVQALMRLAVVHRDCPDGGMVDPATDDE